MPKPLYPPPGAEPFSREPDPHALVESLMKKTATGKVKWEPTADDETFIASIGGQTTLLITTRPPLPEPQPLRAPPGIARPPVGTSAFSPLRGPWLRVLNESGRTIWEVRQESGLAELYELARRIGNKEDERVAVMEALEKL